MNIRTTLYIMTALLAVSCGRKTGDGPTVSRFDGFTQGTTYHILVKSDGPLHMEKEIDSLLTEVDNSMSLYNPQSLLSRLNRNETDSADGFIAECIPDRPAYQRTVGRSLRHHRQAAHRSLWLHGRRTGTKPRRRFAAQAGRIRQDRRRERPPCGKPIPACRST